MQADLVAKAGSDTVYFGTDEVRLDAASQATLAAQARWMLANPIGQAARSRAMPTSAARANIIWRWASAAPTARKNFLIANGVPAARLTVISWGKERPAAVGSDENAWAQNRRSVTVVVR